MFLSSSFPERFLFHSYQLFHVTNVVLSSIPLYTVQLNAQLQYSTLTYSDYYVSSFNSTFPILYILYWIFHNV